MAFHFSSQIVVSGFPSANLFNDEFKLLFLKVFQVTFHLWCGICVLKLWSMEVAHLVLKGNVAYKLNKAQLDKEILLLQWKSRSSTTAPRIGSGKLLFFKIGLCLKSLHISVGSYCWIHMSAWIWNARPILKVSSTIFFEIDICIRRYMLKYLCSSSSYWL